MDKPIWLRINAKAIHQFIVTIFYYTKWLNVGFKKFKQCDYKYETATTFCIFAFALLQKNLANQLLTTNSICLVF